MSTKCETCRLGTDLTLHPQPEVNCHSRDRSAKYDDIDTLYHFDKDGYVCCTTLEAIDSDATCEFWKSKEGWEAEIPTAGGWWVIENEDNVAPYRVYSKAVMSPGALKRFVFKAHLLSEVYEFLARQERKEE